MCDLLESMLRVMGVVFRCAFAAPTPIAVMTLLLSATAVLAWGTGHEDQTRAIFDRLPESLRAEMSDELRDRAIHSFSKYPDAFLEFDPVLIGQEAVDRLTANGINNRYGLHSDTGRAVAFCLLVDAIREREVERTALWIAVLGHSAGDMSATNHDPLGHVVTHGLVAYEDLRLPNGQPLARIEPKLDLTWTARHPDGGRDVFARTIDRMRLEDEGQSAREALLEIMLYGHEGASFLVQRGTAIVADAAHWVEGEDLAARQRLWENVSELGAWTVVRILRDVEVALRLTESGERVELTDAIKTAHQQNVERHLRDRRLDNDALFAPVLRPLPIEERPAIGVVLEPTWQMNHTMLGFGDRHLVVAICRTLSLANRPYATLDVREVLRDGFPLSQRMPVVILSASNLQSYHWMRTLDLDRHLQTYMEGGGQVLWIGGGYRPPASLSAFREAMRENEEHRHWPLPLDKLMEYHLRLVGASANGVWRFVRSPEPRYSWGLPRCRYWFADLENHQLEALMELVGPDHSLVVGALWPAGQPRAAYLPIYSLHRYLLTEAQLVEDLAEPKLDAAGETILFGTLDHLGVR